MKLLARTALALTALALAPLGCSKEEHAATTAPSASAAPSVAPATPSAPATTASAAPTPPPAPKHECPKGSTGDGTFAVPCEAKGKTRMMEATWTGKIDDKGPHFQVKNLSPSVIAYGKVAVYFYDKAGKQLDVKDASGKPAKFATCNGNNLFGGVMKGNEKAVLMFSCTGKAAVPEGATAIEAEIPMVGFTDETEKKVEYYWANPDLAPEARPKGGIKK